MSVWLDREFPRSCFGDYCREEVHGSAGLLAAGGGDQT